MWPALIFVSIAVSAWAWWIAHSPRAPGWARGLAPVIAAITIATGAYTQWRLHDAFDSVSATSAADRQAHLSSGIAGAYTVLAVGWGLAALAIVVVTYAALRRRGVLGAPA